MAIGKLRPSARKPKVSVRTNLSRYTKETSLTLPIRGTPKTYRDAISLLRDKVNMLIGKQ